MSTICTAAQNNAELRLCGYFLFVAFLSPTDQCHSIAIDVMNDISGQIVTTSWVMVELGNFLCASPQRSLFVPFVQELQANPSVRLLPANQDLLEKGLALYARRPDKDWSLTDCMAFVVMKELALSDALTADKHFQQAGFNALLL